MVRRGGGGGSDELGRLTTAIRLRFDGSRTFARSAVCGNMIKMEHLTLELEKEADGR